MEKQVFGGTVNLKVALTSDGQPVMHAHITAPLTVNGIAIDGSYSLTLAKSGQSYHHSGSLRRAGTYTSLPWETKAYGKVRDLFIEWANDLLNNPQVVLATRAETLRWTRNRALAKASQLEEEARGLRQEAEAMTVRLAEMDADLARMEGAV
jgi:hypothetical protein